MNTMLPLWILMAVSCALATPAADCTQPVVTGPYTVGYMTKAAFPATSEAVNFAFLSDFVPDPGTTVCGVVYTPHVTLHSVRHGYPDLPRMTRDLATGTPRQIGLFLPLKSFSMNFGKPSDRYSTVVIDLASSRVSYQLPRSLDSVPTLGVKINGGPLIPLYYNGKASVVPFPKNAVIDLYANPDSDTYVPWEHVNVNLKQASVEYFQNGPFPAK